MPQGNTFLSSTFYHWVISYLDDIGFFYMKLISFIVECETILNALEILKGESFLFL